jgi:carbamoylphosphate synthase large subunit
VYGETMSSDEAKHSLWVSSAGTGTAYGLCKSAREYFGSRIRIVAADTNPRHLVAASAIADAFEQVPPVSSPDFGDVLLAGFSRHGIDTYQPVLDEEIVLAAQMVASGQMPAAVVVLAPTASGAAACFDKLETGRRLSAAGLVCPVTTLAAEAQWTQNGVLAKPRFGLGSVGVRILRSEFELNALRAETNLIAQEICSGPEITVDTFRSRNGDMFRAICRERIETKAGVCTKARVFEDAELESIARRICVVLDLWGTICFQVMRNERGSWAVTDVNPRPGAGTRMSAAVGVDLLVASLLDVWRGDPSVVIPKLNGERFVVRTYVEHVFESAE